MKSNQLHSLLLLIVALSTQACTLDPLCEFDQHRHYNVNGECVEDTDNECGIMRVNCTQAYDQGVTNGTCQDGVCIPTQCDDANSYHLDNKNHQCTQRCECDRYGADRYPDVVCDDAKIKACVNIECAKDNVYCIDSTEKFKELPQWIAQKRQTTTALEKNETLNVFLTQDIAIDTNAEQWEPIRLSYINFSAFGDTDKRRKITSDKPLAKSLFSELDHAMIANIGFEYDVHGSDARGALANVSQNSQIYDVERLGNLTNTNDTPSDIPPDFATLYEQTSLGIGGLIGHAQNTTFFNIILGSVDQPCTVNASNHAFVGGLTGILCNGSRIQCDTINEDESQCHFYLANVSGTDCVGGLAGIIDMSSTRNTHSFIQSVSGNNHVGGFAGFATDLAYIQDVDHTSEKIVGNNHVGGFIGQNEAFIQNIDAASTNIQGKMYVGGLVGDNTGTLENVNLVASNIEGENFVGGLAGRNFANIKLNSNHVKTVTGTNNVGGLIGSLELGNVHGDYILTENDTQKSVNHTVQTRVNGSANVGGVIGMMAGGSIDGLHTQIQEVQGSNDIGGFVGKVFSNSDITNINHRIEQIHDYATDATPTSEKSGLGGFAGRIEKMAKLETCENYVTSLESQTHPFVGGFVGYLEGTITDIKKNHVTEIHATADTVGGFVGHQEQGYISNIELNEIDNINAEATTTGGFVGNQKGIISNIEKNDVNTITGSNNRNGGTGGFAGYIHKNAILQNVTLNKIDKITDTFFAGGCVGLTNGFVLNVNSTAGRVIANTQFAGGFTGRIDTDGIISDSQNEADFVMSPIEAGGFAAECDGEAVGIHTMADHVVSSYSSGGAFAGMGGKASNIINVTKRVENIPCTGDLDYEAHPAPFHCTMHINDEFTHDATIDHPFLAMLLITESRAGGFVASGDGMYNSEYTAIINRVNMVKGKNAGGFMGKYNFRNYTIRHVVMENISSWANVNGDPNLSGLLFGEISGLETMDSNQIATNGIHIRNIMLMGHLYDETTQIENHDNTIFGLNGLPKELPLVYLAQIYIYCFTDHCKFDKLSTSAFTPIYDFNTIPYMHSSDGMRPAVKWKVFESDDNNNEKYDFPELPEYFINNFTDEGVPIISFEVQ